ncbi:hypothetical protein AAMO2058_000898400 [Amorphochlora amoebiformis]
MESIVDPLTILRQAVKDGKLDEIKMEGDKIEIGRYKYAKKTKTAYRSRKGKGSQYTLGALIFFLRHGKEKYGRYVSMVKGAKLMTVPRTDHAELRDYLEGRTDSSPYVDTMALMETKPIQLKEAKHQKPKTFDHAMDVEEKEVGTEDQIKRMERQWAGRNSKLDHPTISFKKITSIFRQVEKEIVKEHRKRDRSREKRSSEDKHKRHKHSHKKHNRHKDSKQIGKSPARRRSSSSISLPKILKVVTASDGSMMHIPKKRYLSSDHKYRPIIIVPTASSSLITLWNAKYFLQHKKYIPSKEIQRTMKKKPRYVEIKRPSLHNPKRSVEYIIVDQVEKLSYEEWHQVVAVFASGALWQFKYYPLKSPAEIFERFCGFHVYMKTGGQNKVKKNIENWKVHKLALSSLRHQDKDVCYAFWKIVSPILQARYSNLMI